VDQAHARVADLLAGAGQGRVLREGLRVAILGRPNVGKSSLLNALLGVDRAIVTPVAGTTRDTIEETATLRGIAVHLVDTAGLAETADPVERAGVERTRAAARAADLALLVLDGSAPLTPEDAAAAAAVRALGFGGAHAYDDAGDRAVVGASGGRPQPAGERARMTDASPTSSGGRPRPPGASRDGGAWDAHDEDGDMPIRPLILVRNKTDLPPAWEDAAAAALVADSGMDGHTRDGAHLVGPSVNEPPGDGTRSGGMPLVRTSAVSAGGVAALEEAIANLALGGTAQGADPLVASARHADALRRAAADLARASAALDDGIPLDLVSLDLRGALDALGEITGETATADLLDRIFAEFCIGK
jgi:tRNA U34 5-carboxymethylaminomethyl modifying GTPase MnmE/TrmE